MEKEQWTTSGKCGDNLSWRFEEETLYIAGTGAMYDEHWSVDSREWEDVKTYIKRIVIQEGCTYIGEYVFCGCINLMDVSIPDSVECIGYYAFGDCGNIQSVLVPDAFIRLTGEAGDCNCYMHPLINKERFITNVFRGTLFIDEETMVHSFDEVKLKIHLRKKGESLNAVGDRGIYYLDRKSGLIIRDFYGKSYFKKQKTSPYSGIYSYWVPIHDAAVDLQEISEEEARVVLNRYLLRNIDPVKLKELILPYVENETDISWDYNGLVPVVQLLGFEDYYGLYLNDWNEEKMVPNEMDAWQIRVCISRIFAECDLPWGIRDDELLTEQSLIWEMLFRLEKLLADASL